MKIRIIIKGFALVGIFGLLSSCGGSSGGGTSSVPDAPAGIYSGTITPSGGSADGATALFTTDNRVAIVDIDTLEGFIGTITNNSKCLCTKLLFHDSRQGDVVGINV